MNIERQTLIPPRAMKCFQQLKAAIVCRSKNTLLPNKFLVADHYSTLSADYGKVVQNDAVDDFQHVQDTKQSSSTSQTSKTGHYQYVSDRNTGIVWKNVGLFLLLHGTYFFAVYLFFTRDTHKTWMFSFIYGCMAGLGITAGAHRLWSHKAYKANYGLRFFLMCCHCIAGQNDLHTWCRDHRVHHKFSDTDADPHNSKRGAFFSHMGWLLRRKHQDVFRKGATVSCYDLLRDPVIVFQKRYYELLFLIFNVALPTLAPVYFWDECWTVAFFYSFARYCTTLHCTWFVNSAAHLWGDRPFNVNIVPRENWWVSFGAFGEGFHNYHHTFPFDYATSELGMKWNMTTVFINIFAAFGWAYDLKKVSPAMIQACRERTGELGPHAHH